MDQFNICRFEVDDRRTLDKDKICQSHQRAVVLNSIGAITRRKQWLESRKSKTRTISSSGIVPTDPSNLCSKKRRRAPNRSKEVIQAEKEQKRQRKADKEAKRAALLANIRIPADEPTSRRVMMRLSSEDIHAGNSISIVIM